ncbi:signal peptidase I [Oceanobacillus massiliensis]|uniref:signal peptidase I n=1 Tax=Oceanobacillus massiliensis TaxID=1465765 RepID=UPI003016F906
MESNLYEINEPAVIKEKNEKDITNIGSWIVFALILAVVFFTFRFVIGITVVSGNSMSPSLEDGDFLVSSNIFYTPEASDIIIFHNENGFDVIKRVIGLPNDTVEIKNGMVLINGNPLNEDYIAGAPNDMAEITVSEDSYFVMGDNRTPGESLDSRSPDVGTIARDAIRGEVLVSIYPFDLLSTK